MLGAKRQRARSTYIVVAPHIFAMAESFVPPRRIILRFGHSTLNLESGTKNLVAKMFMEFNRAKRGSDP